MIFRKSTLLLIAVSMIAALVGCSSSSRPITVTLSSIGPNLAVNSQTAITATLANDSKNGGVKWTCTVASGSCGTFASPQTASGVAVTYTAPAIATSGVVITATAVDNTSITASTSALAIGPAQLADGSYVFSVTGWDYGDISQFTVTGVIVISGGAITGGEQDFADLYNQLQDDINGNGCNNGGSCITAAADGNLSISLVTCLVADCTQTDTVVGVNGVETLAGSILPFNPNKASITEFDASATGSGRLEAQDPAVLTQVPPGPASYAFLVGGLDELQANEFMTMGGVIYVDGAAGTGTISGTGSVYDAADDVFNIGLYQKHDFLNTSSVSAPDPLGRVTFTLDTPDFPEMILAGYLVSGNKIQLIETVDSFGGALAGTAYTQNVPAGGFTAAGVANTYVIGMQGVDTSQGYFLQTASQLTLASAGTVSGFLDFNDFSAAQPVSPDPVSAPAYTVDPTGRVTISGLTDGSVVDSLLYIYLDGNGHALAMTLDDTDIQGGAGVQQTGAGAFAATSFYGGYAMGVTGVDLNEDGPFDSVGPVIADGSSSFAGFGDANWLDITGAAPITVSDNAVSGAFISNSNGIFTGTIKGMDIVNCPAFTSGAPGCTSDAFNFYLVDAAGESIAIETDQKQLTIGYFLQQ